HIAVVELEASGRSARCIPPGTKLAELYVLQGRLEEAERAVGDADDETSLLVRARLALAQDRRELAVTLAERCCRRLGDHAQAVSALVVLAQAHLANGDARSAGLVADQLDT